MKEATPVKAPLDPTDRTLQHIANLASLEMSEPRRDRLVPVLVPGASVSRVF